MKKHIAFILFIAVIFNSCSIEKRIYQPGYFISGRSSSPKEEKIQKKFQPSIFSESAKNIADADTSLDKSNEETTAISLIEKLPVIKPAIKAELLVQEKPNLLESYSDSLPNEIKLLSEQYAKTQKLKNKFLILTSIPVSISLLGFLTAIILFVPMAYGAFSNDTDDKIIRFITICVGAVLLAIPLFIVFLILAIKAKKQKKKLGKMGAL